MPLLNYTTAVPASRSISEITQMLQDGGASHIMLKTGTEREVTAVSFVLQNTAFGSVSYTIPANVGAVILAVNAQIEDETDRQRRTKRYKRKIPTGLFNNKAQAERIAWRISKDWLEAQLALATVGSAKLEQIMLPFANVAGGNFYECLVSRGSLALPASC